MADEGPQQVLISLHGPGRLARSVGEHLEVHTNEIGQRVEFEIAPEVFDGIQFGRVRGQEFSVEMGAPGEKASHLGRSMGRQAIPDEDRRSLQLLIELTQETNDPHRIDIGRVQPEIQMHGIPLRRDAQGSDNGDLAIQAGALPEHGRVPSRTPAAAHQRRRQKAGFIDKNQPSLQSRSVFLPAANPL